MLFFWELAHHRSLKSPPYRTWTWNPKFPPLPTGQFQNPRDSKNANICSTQSNAKKRFEVHVYNKTDHKPQEGSKKCGQKTGTGSKQYKKHEEESFITTDAIELLIFQKDLKNVDQFRSCFLQLWRQHQQKWHTFVRGAVLMSLEASMRDLTLIWVPVTIVGLFLELSSRSRDPCHLFPSSECLKAYNFLRLLVWVANWIQFTPIRKLAFLAIMQYMKRALAFLSVTMMKHLKKRPPKSLSHGLEK